MIKIMILCFKKVIYYGKNKSLKKLKNFKKSVDTLGYFYYNKNVLRINGRLAQLVEHLPYKQGVIGSSPIATTIIFLAW